MGSRSSLGQLQQSLCWGGGVGVRTTGRLCGQVLGEEAVPTPSSYGAGPPFFPKQVLAGGNGTPSTYQGRPPTASRSFLCRRDFWANGDLTDRFPVGLGGGEGISHLEKHLQETIFWAKVPG